MKWKYYSLESIRFFYITVMFSRTAIYSSGKNCQFFEPWRARHLFLCVRASLPTCIGFLSACMLLSHLSRLSSCVYAGSHLGFNPLGWVTKKKKKNPLDVRAIRERKRA